MRTLRSWLAYALAGALLLSASSPVLACTACFGQSDSNLAKGMNMGIFALLLGATVFFFIALMYLTLWSSEPTSFIHLRR